MRSVCGIDSKDTPFGAEGAKLIANALMGNACLKTLRIRSTFLPLLPPPPFYYSLFSFSITVVWIDHEVGDEGVKALMDSLEFNRTLKKLDLSCSLFTLSLFSPLFFPFSSASPFHSLCPLLSLSFLLLLLFLFPHHFL